eukprot:jgi/Picre1/33014/NNA_008341.t1
MMETVHRYLKDTIGEFVKATDSETLTIAVSTACGLVVVVLLLVAYLNYPMPVPSIYVGVGLMDEKPKGLTMPGRTRSPSKRGGQTGSSIPCYDPGTMELLGYAPAMHLSRYL